MLDLEIKNGELFAMKDGHPVGTIVNHTSGLLASKGLEDPCLFSRIFEGHGSIYHVHENPPNPFFLRNWNELFSNPELLPESSNIFIDSDNSFYYATLETSVDGLKLSDLPPNVRPSVVFDDCSTPAPIKPKKDAEWGKIKLFQIKELCNRMGITDIYKAVNEARHKLTPYDARRELAKGSVNRNNIFIEEMFDLFDFVPNKKIKREVARQCYLIFDFEPSGISTDNKWKLDTMASWIKING